MLVGEEVRVGVDVSVGVAVGNGVSVLVCVGLGSGANQPPQVLSRTPRHTTANNAKVCVNLSTVIMANRVRLFPHPGEIKHGQIEYLDHAAIPFYYPRDAFKQVSALGLAHAQVV